MDFGVVSALALIVKIALDQWEGSRAMAGLVCSFCKKAACC